VLSILPRTLKSFAALRAGALTRVAQFDKNESSDPRALKAEQDQRLRALVLIAAEQVPFWKRRFARYGVRPSEVRSLRDLAVLPPLDDRDLVDFADELGVGGTPDPAWHTVRGLDEPRRRVRIDQEARRLRVADELRHIGWMGLDWRTPRAILAGRDERGEALESAGGKLRSALKSGVWLQPGRADEAAVRRFITDAGACGAELLSGSPSSLERVADEIETGTAHNGRAPFRPRAVQTWGECLSPETRRRLTDALGAPVFDTYRTLALGEIAHECAERDGLHVSTERVALEFVRDGDPVDDGDDGEILVTALDNVAMPLFRYKVGDVGCRVPAGAPCACGRTSERMYVTDGRASSLLTSPTGQRVHPDWFDWLFEEIAGVLDWRVTQESSAALTVTIVPGVAWRDEAAEWIVDGLRGTDPAFTVVIERADALPTRADGRRVRVRSTMPLAWAAIEARA